MPSSTTWRRRLEDWSQSHRSPSPPTLWVEPLSPVLGPSPHLLERTQHDWNEHQSSGNALQGLGVSYDATNDGFDQPRGLYLDHNGQAHVELSAIPTANGHHSLGSSRIKYAVRPHTSAGASLKRTRAKAHTRSGSTIDDLASAAIATSPTFTRWSPTSQHVTRPATAYLQSQEYADGEPPPKRIHIRSEKLRSHEWSPREDGHLDTQISLKQREMEAELLLSLRNGFDFKHHGSPPAHQSASFRTPRAQATSPRPASAEDIPMKEALAVGKALPITTPTKVSPGRLQTSFVRERTIGSPQAPEPEPLTSPPQAEPEEEVQADVDRSKEAFQTVEEETAEKQVVNEEEANTISSDRDAGARPPAALAPAEPIKKPKRIKPEIQQDVCPKCQHLQQETRSEDGEVIPWIKCNPCNRWFHAACVGFKDKRETQTVDKFVCSECEPSHGPTTFVRKSSRARTAIDYAELNQGLIKSSAATTMHHYVQLIKDGKIKFHPEDFLRVPPEFMTAENLENSNGVRRPLVIPAYLNPRFGERTPPAAGQQSVPGATIDAETPDLPPAVNDDFVQEEVVDCDQDSLDMVMPRDLTVRKVAQLYGPEAQVIVIDVKTQSSSNKWSMKRWADYYESTGDKPIRNVISLEITKSLLGRIIRRPKFVRDIDLQDLVWPDACKTATWKPVQLYCLMSVADSYTDFHIDFGGSSVYYHILKGKKTFFFIPPEEKNLKKYEDWCNSDKQDENFLGDLTGECSRVDLSEGDTMFIPAGWIHAVWTPEDSLVIGGNFLTRFDYEMQLRVAEAEKNTNVAPSFKYPFFQKVMWYTLINYLETDPIPLEVADDFNDDEEHVFRRANPVWHEFGELQNPAEPGQPEYNVRYYSKSEIKGLPALRDFLYRTALIYVDAPVVPPVTKDGAKRVRASIPKGHGEPMDLIKSFAIWCAWKTGDVTVPSWARPDAVALQKLAEDREKQKKPEIFRIPPERTSSRKSSQALTDVPMLNSEAMKTPTKTMSSVDVESDDGAKRSGSSKTSGLGPKRSACDPCRKRRIRCRHRDEVDGPSSAETPRPQNPSNVFVEVPKMSMTTTLLSVEGSVSTEHEYPEFTDGLQSNIAQAALATMDMQSVEPIIDANNTPTTSSGKKGRSRACEECRKSKRRCVHDEFGRVDPAKAAEPSKPRGSSGTKLPSISNDELRPPLSKKLKLEAGTIGLRQSSTGADFDALIDPALMVDAFSAPHSDAQPTLPDAAQLMHSAAEALQVSTQESETVIASVPADPVVGNTATTTTEVPVDPLLDQEMIDAPSSEIVVKPEPITLVIENVASQTPAGSLASPPDSTTADAAFSPPTTTGVDITSSIETGRGKSETSPEDFYTPLSTSRHSSRPAKVVDRYRPDEGRSMVKPMSKTAKRDSSSGASGETAVMSSKSWRSSSNTSGTTHQMAAALQNGVTRSRENSVRPGSRGSEQLSSEGDTDEAFARELQAQENGLRRRQSGRV